MKRIFYFLTAFIILASCNKNGTGNFVVSGTVKNATENTIYLKKLSYNSTDIKVIDSAKIGTDGAYKLRGNDTQQNLYVLSFKDNASVILVNDAEDIRINFDMNGFHYPDISGSDATNQLYKFIRDCWEKDSLVSITYYKLDSITQEQLKDTMLINRLQQQYAKEFNALQDVIRHFISTSNSPADICFALDKAKGAISPDELYALTETASRRFPEHTGLALFKSSQTQAMAGSATTGSYALLNQQAPDLTMPDMHGKKVSISNFRGKYLLIDFWASWCGPCRRENPSVVAAYNKFRNKNFEILGVSLDDNKADWLTAIKNDNLTWPQISDLKHWESSAVSAYQFEGIPFNVLIDPQGKIVAAGLRDEALDQKLSEVLQ